MGVLYSKENAREHYKRSFTKVDKSVFMSNKSTLKKMNMKNKYKEVVDLKEACVVLQDCLRLKNILNNVSMMHNIPLQFRLVNKRLKNTNNKNDIFRKYSKRRLLLNSQLGENSIVQKPKYITRSKVKLSKKKFQMSTVNKNDIKKMNKNLEVSENLKENTNDSFLEKKSVTKIADENIFSSWEKECSSNQILLTNEKQNFVLEQRPIQNNVSGYDFTNNLSDNPQKENLNSESLLKEIDKIYANEIDLQRKDKDSNKDINYDKITEVVDLETIQNVSKDNLFVMQCSENENIVLSHTTVTLPKIIDEEDDTTQTARKNLYKNTDLTNKKCTVTDQNNISDDNVKRNLNFTSRSHNDTSKDLKEEKYEVRTCRIINKKICDSPHSIQLRESTVSEINRSSIENQFLLDEENLNKEEVEDNDCLSLFADSTLMQEYNTYLDDNSEKSFQMTDDVIENYCKNTTSDFNKVYNNNENNVSKEVARSRLEQVTSVQKDNTVFQKSLQNPQISTPWNLNVLKSIFRGFCYYTIMYNKCLKNNCRFKHDFISTMINWYIYEEEYLFKILEELVFNHFTDFVRNFYLELLRIHSQRDIQCVLKILKKLYELKAVNDDTVFRTIDCLKQTRYSIKIIIHEISIIVNNSDFEFVNCVLKQLKEHIVYGEYWSTLKDLLLRIENLDPKIVETILQECITTHTHIEEVNLNVMRKLSHQICWKINNDVLLSFKNLIKSKEKTQLVDKNIQAKDNETKDISSPDLCVINELETDEHMNILNITETVERINENSSFKLHLIDNLPKPHSTRIRFWKFYIDIVHKLHVGFKHNDYDYVMNILNSVKEEQQTFFTHACYQILCNKIRHSHYHLKKLILHAVRAGVTATCYEILFDIVKYALITLAEKNLWVLAYMLLEDINIIIQTQMYFHKIDAATIMLIAEIYLANHLAVKAFLLLKQTNIIYTDTCKWKVHYTAKDISIRVRIMTILLNALCETFVEHAFYLFQFLVVDQYSNFYPIDITNFVNKAVPMLLTRKNYFLIIHIAKLIIHYNFVLNTITYRILIATLIHIDMALTKRLYQTAVGLGIYSRIQLYPTIYLIINTDWTKEEMYLAILDSIEQLSLHIGHGIGHIKRKDFSIYLNFENVPLHKKHTYNKRMYQHKITKSKILMKNILEKQFNPPILITKRKKDKIFKLNTLSVLNHLKHKAKQCA